MTPAGSEMVSGPLGCVSGPGIAEAGVPLAELIRRVGISEQTFYRWKKQYVGLEQLVADLTLDKAMLQDVLAKKC